MCYTERKAALVVRSYQDGDMAHTAENHEQMNTDHIKVLVKSAYALSLIAHLRQHPQMHRRNKVSSLDVIQWILRRLLVHHELSTMIKTTRCQSRRKMSSAEKRKVDETAKSLRASLPRTTLPHASSLRPDDETHEQLTRSAKPARTAKTENETLQDVSFLL